MAAALLLMTLFAPSAAAQEATEISFYGGRTAVDAKVLSSSLGSKATAPGAVYGLSWLRAMSSLVRVGLDFCYLKPKAATLNEPGSSASFHTGIDSASLLGVLRVGASEGDFRPHFLVGLGAHQTTIDLDATPNPGFVWKDSGTSETREVLHSSGHGVAAKFQGGADYAFNDNLLAGAFVSYHLLGTATYPVTPSWRALGLSDAKGSMTAVSFGARLSASF